MPCPAGAEPGTAARAQRAVPLRSETVVVFTIRCSEKIDRIGDRPRFFCHGLLSRSRPFHQVRDPWSGRVMAHSLEIGRFVPTGLAMSIKRLRRRPSQATFPPPSLKFRTSGFPRYGFKPRRLIGQPCPAQKNRRLKRQVRIPRQPSGLTQPSSPWCRPADSCRQRSQIGNPGQGSESCGRMKLLDGVLIPSRENC